MLLTIRKKNSQRTRRPIRLKFFPNYGGQGGSEDIVMQDDEGNWYTFTAETDKEAREVMSQAAIARLNRRDR